MKNLVLYIGTSARDIEQYKLLIHSIYKHNKNGLKIYTAVNDVDINLFKDRFSDKNITFIKDSEIYNSDLSKVDGWRKQQLIKMNFHKLGVCKTFVQIDSDSFFINDFYTSDFMFNDNVPYTVIHENKELLEYFVEYNLYESKRSNSENEHWTDIGFKDVSRK